ATLQVQWPDAGPGQQPLTRLAVVLPDGTTTIDQANFSAANGLSLLPQLLSGHASALALVGSSDDPYIAIPGGTYQLRLPSNVKFSAEPTLDAAYGYARPQITRITPSKGSSPLQFQVSLSGQMVSTLGPNARISLFVDGDNQDHDGTPVPGATDLPITPPPD